MSDSPKSNDIGLRAQKKILSKMSTKKVAKKFINDTLGSLLDNVFGLARAYCGNKKDAEKLVNNIIKIVIKIGILYTNDQFTEEELKTVEQFVLKFRSVAKTIIKYYEYSGYDRKYLTKELTECHTGMKQLVQNHLTEKSLSRIDMVFGFFTNPQFLDAIFKKNSEYREQLGLVVNDMKLALQESR